MSLFNVLKKKKQKEVKTEIPVKDKVVLQEEKEDKKERSVQKHQPKAGPPLSEKTQKAKAITPKPIKKSTKRKEERFSHIILMPRITEKASLQSGGNSYTFNIAPNANKIQVKQAVKEIYDVEPVRVNIINMKPKKKIVRGIKGKAPSFKKAIVFLKKDDTIEFI